MTESDDGAAEAKPEPAAPEPTAPGDLGEPAEPTADDVEALVRSIAAKEAATSTTAPDAAAAAAEGEGPKAVAPEPEPTSAARPVVVASARTSGNATTATPSTGGGAASPTERRHPVRPATTRPGSAAPIRAPLAGLIGRLEWERLVADESQRQRRYGRPSAIVLVEVGGLDAAAAQSGSGVVARVVPPCAETLVALARASDRVTRLGDGRFGVLLRETDADGASRYAARAVAACDPWLAAMPWPLRLHVGWASPEGAEDLTDAVQIAERRLADAQATALRGDLA